MRIPILESRSLLAVSFAAAMLSVVLSGAVEYFGMVRLDRAAVDVRRGDAALAAAAEDMREDVLELRRYEKDVFMNVDSPALLQEYKAKWDSAFGDFRHDLVRARRAGATSQDAQLQRVTDQMAAYKVAFADLYASISNGTLRNTQQANDEFNPFKGSVRDAESSLAEISDSARDARAVLAPALVAQRFGLAVSLLLFLALAALLVGCLRRLPAAGYA